jgi:hypothetical protein
LGGDVVINLAVIASAPSTAGQFLGVDWGSIALVCVAALLAGVTIVTLYSLGLRLLAVGSADEPADAGGPPAATVQDATAQGATGPRPLIATVGAVVCIGVSILAALYGIYLVIPLFH